jgi:hypothetical protein
MVLNTNCAEVSEEWCVRGSPNSTTDGSATLQMEPAVCEIKCSGVHASFERQHGSLLKNNPDAAQETTSVV